tara:strand:+ start:1456 stop:1746 length:291 start_codon:yes stop_codon:yes gene_type:complete
MNEINADTLKANDLVRITMSKPWTKIKGNKIEKFVQKVTFIANVTNVFNTRFEYELSRVVSHSDVMPTYDISSIRGGAAFRALNRMDIYSLKVRTI